MMDLLEIYDKRLAAGVLARAALALESGDNAFATKPIVENEAALRAALIAEARSRLGIKPDDQSPEVIERIGLYLDEQSEDLVGEPHTTSAFERLIRRGDYPSDLYDIRIIPNIRNFFGKDFEREKALIERTVRMPAREQHYGPPTGKNEPYLISLFARQFKTPFPFRDFTMLVAGGRAPNFTLEVHQAWRLYSSKVPTEGAADLVELLRRFADVYGADIEVDGQRGRFFLTAEKVLPPRITIMASRGKSETITVTQFAQRNPTTQRMHAALIVAIDLNRYRETLEKMDCKTIL